jgi:hypothetical protein
MDDTPRSQLPCPVCGQHALAIDEPPRIDVMGVQAYSDIVGMGDLKQVGAVGIICLSCGSRWRDRDAFDRGEREPDGTGGAGPDGTGGAGPDGTGGAGPDDSWTLDDAS